MPSPQSNKRKATSPPPEEEARPRPEQPRHESVVGVRDYTKKCAADALLVMASFLRDHDVLRFGRTSASNFQATKNYPRRRELRLQLDLKHIVGDPRWMIGRWANVNTTERGSMVGVIDAFTKYVQPTLVAVGLHVSVSLYISNEKLTTKLYDIFPRDTIASLDLTCDITSLNLTCDLNTFTLPPRLKRLALTGPSRVLREIVWPPSSLEELVFHGFRILADPLRLTSVPSSLKVLQFGWNFNEPIKFAIPPFLEVLDLGRSFNHPIDIGTLPQSLRVLRLGCHYGTPFDVKKLPPLRTLRVGSPQLTSHLCELPMAYTSLTLHFTSTRRDDLQRFRKTLNTLGFPSTLETLEIGICTLDLWRDDYQTFAKAGGLLPYEG